MGRNWQWSFEQGRTKRLAAEKAAFESGQPIPASAPLHSHDGTMQSQFTKGWNSVTLVQIQRHLHPPKPLGHVLTDNTRLRDLFGM